LGRKHPRCDEEEEDDAVEEELINELGFLPSPNVLYL
jgi:hypothetical protein